MNIADILERAGTLFASRPICIFNDTEQSFPIFFDQVARLSTALTSMGARKGRRVILLSSNRPELLVSFFAVWSVGAVAVPINPALAAREACAIVEHCEPAIVIVEEELSHLLSDAKVSFERCAIGAGENSQWHELAASAEPMAAVSKMSRNDPAIIYYTSGTTGLPKGAVISHSAALFTASMFSRHLLISPSDRLLIAGPMAFILHLTMNALTALSGGASIVILKRFHPDLVFKAIEQHRISVLIAVPTAYVMMVNSLNGRHVSLPSVRLAISAGASLPDSLSQRILSNLGIPVFDLWGMTESGPITTYDPSTDAVGRPDSCGRPLPSCEIRIVDDELNSLPTGEIGEVLLRCPGLMTGYYKNPEATASTLVDGWMRSGDLAKIDADGFLYIVGRKKDMIIRGGANIYPVDIEEVLYAHDAVGECAVVGIPDQTFGEIVKAFVVVRDGKQVKCSDLAEHCRQHIAEYKVPSDIQIVESLPKGATGKILRRQLRDMSIDARRGISETLR